ncbi:MAG: hypothetical protein JKY27_12980 [Magnetovibrio sp.]|nr:hypothetical protein [Magnetovibrio sp.]
MTAGGPKKFLFDTDFSPNTNPKAQLEQALQSELEAELAQTAQKDAEEPEEIIPTFSEEDLQRARDEGYQTGHATATNDLSTAIEQRLASTLDQLNAQVTSLFDTYTADKEEHSRDAVAVATVIVRKLFPALNMDAALREIKHMITEAMQRTSSVPSLMVRVPPDIRDEIERKASELAALRGRKGTITVIADETLAPGDAAIEWDGGGMTRDSKQMWQEIDGIIERNLGTERANSFALDELSKVSGPESAMISPDIGRAMPDAPRDEVATSPAQVNEETGQEVVNQAPVEDNTKIQSESPETPDPSPDASPVPDPAPATVPDNDLSAKVVEETPDSTHNEG